MDGGAAANGILKLWFSKPELDTVLAQRVTSIGTQDIKTLSIELDIDGAAAAPVIVCYAEQSAQTPIGLITKIKKFPVTFSVAGVQEIDSIPRSGARIMAIHLQKADISKVEVDANSVKVVEQAESAW